MSRRDRREHDRQRRRLTPAQIRRVTQCPDCNAAVGSVEVGPGVHQVFVFHDETCPWLAALERGGGYGVRFGRRE
jgi:hypothetical protein